MASPKRKVHFVGSVPLISTEEVFHALCSAIPAKNLKRLPDGETGERWNFVSWQMDLVQSQPALLNKFFNPNAPDTYTDSEADEIVCSLGEVETGYDVAALESYEIFKRLRREGVIPENVRFQVSLPSVVSGIAHFARHALIARFELVYEAALPRSIDRIQRGIPAADLAIQWDIPIEFVILVGADLFNGIATIKAWFDPVFEGLIERLVKLTTHVHEDIEMGFHLCYGDIEHKHFMEPKDTGKMAEVAIALLENVKRPIDWIHFTVPKDKTDAAYLEPMKPVIAKLGKTELILGLIHADDADGNRDRIASAETIVGSFSVATECGMGRTPKRELDGILKACVEACL